MGLVNAEVVTKDYNVERTVEFAERDQNFANRNNGVLKETLVVGSSQTEIGSLESDFEGKMLVPSTGNGMKNGEVSVLGVATAINGNEDLRIQKDVEDVEEHNSSQDCGVESSRRIQVSGDNISLFVEVFGPLHGISEVDDLDSSSNHAVNENYSDQDNGQEGEGVLHDDGEVKSIQVSEIHKFLSDVTKNDIIDIHAEGGIEVERVASDSQEFKFSVGDLVWVGTKTQSWWPGLIYDPSAISIDAANSNLQGCFLVKYFGSTARVWCTPSKLKPFFKYFDELSRQNNSRSFAGAIEKAVGEVGRRLKMEMTCLCLSKEDESKVASQHSAESKGQDSLPKCKLDELGEFSFSQLVPADFLSFVKTLALDVSMPGKIVLTATQNRLSAFYRSTGHFQLPIHELQPVRDTKDSAGDKVPKDVIPEKVYGELAKLSGREENVLHKCGNRVSEEESDLASTCGRIGRKEAENLNVLGIASSELEMVNNHSISSITTREASLVGSNGEMIVGKSSKSYDTRSRKRSKYLCPPYVNVKRRGKGSPIMGENEKENGKEDSHGGMDLNTDASQSVGAALISDCSGKNSQKKRPRKPITLHDICNKLERRTASSAEFLSELHFAALNCDYPKKSKTFKSVELFFSGFRRITFHSDLSHAVEPVHVAGDGESIHVPQSLHDIGVLNRTGKEEVNKEHGCKLPAGAPSLNETAAYPGPAGKNIPEVTDCLPLIVLKRRRRKKKVETALVRSGTNQISNLSELDVGFSSCQSVVIDFQKRSYIAPKDKLVAKRKKEKQGATPEVVTQNNITVSGLPDLNGNSACSSADYSQVIGTFVQKKRKRKLQKDSEHPRSKSVTGMSDDVYDSELSPALKDVQIMISDLNGKVGMKDDTLIYQNSGIAVTHEAMNGTNIKASSEQLQTCVLFPIAKPECKTRKRKDKAASDLKPEATASIPDLNGNATLPESNGTIPTEVKPKRRRRRRKNKADIGVPSIYTNYNRLLTNSGEAYGTAVVLKFAPGFSMPSKENLVATFGGFGALKESETQIGNDNIAKIVFTRNSDAVGAIQSLEKNNPFGAGLVSYHLNLLSATSDMLPSSWQRPSSSLMMPCGGRLRQMGEIPSPPPPVATDLSYMRQNLEMMTTMLEKAGDDLSPDMRTKLETQIKSLLGKISNISGSSSSS